MNRGHLNIARIFSAILLVIAGLIGSASVATPANASVTYYHAYCTSDMSCWEGSIPAIWLDVNCIDCFTPSMQTTVIARSNGTAVVLDTLIVVTSTGTYTQQGQQLYGCLFQNACDYTYPGRLLKADLYAHEGTYTRFAVTSVLSPSVMALGSTASLHGYVMPNSAGKWVVLQRYYGGAWHSLSWQTLSTASGYNFAIMPTARGIYGYRVVKPAEGSIAAGATSMAKLDVGLYLVSGRLSATSMRPGSTTYASGVVTPNRAGQRVVLQRYYNYAWHNAWVGVLSPRSTYSMPIRIGRGGTYVYRVCKPGDSLYTTGFSANLVVRVG